MNTNHRLMLLSLLALALVIAPATARAVTEADVVAVEQRLIQLETELLPFEARCDAIIIELWKFDGVGGWFQGKKKDALKKEYAQAQASIDAKMGEIRSLQNQVQKMVFQVAQAYEQAGNFEKAIDFYLKISNQTDEVKFRIASCYKAMKNYESAIQWLMRMGQSDAVSLHIVDCYRLDNRWRDAFTWLFKILEPFSNSESELNALQLVRTYDYPGKLADFPDFNQRVSDVYINKAFCNYSSNFAQARDDYREAIKLITNGQDERTTSFGMMTRYQGKYQAACEVLEQQKTAAEQYYADMLRNAQRNIDEAQDRLRRAEYDADQRYRYELQRSWDELQRAQRELQQAQSAASPSAQLIAQAQAHVNECQNAYTRLYNGRQWFMDRELDPHRRAVDEAMRNYRHIVDSRAQIIGDYIAPYQKQVQQAQQTFQMIQTLHQGAYGG